MKNIFKVFLIGFLFSGCMGSYKVVFKGNEGSAVSRLEQKECPKLWSTYKGDGTIEDVYGEPCQTIIRYKTIK